MPHVGEKTKKATNYKECASNGGRKRGGARQNKHYILPGEERGTKKGVEGSLIHQEKQKNFGEQSLDGSNFPEPAGLKREGYGAACKEEGDKSPDKHTKKRNP